MNMKTLRMIGTISQPKDLPENWALGLDFNARERKLQAAPLCFSAYTLGNEKSYIMGTNERFYSLEAAVLAIQARMDCAKALVIETTNESHHEGWGQTWIVADATDMTTPAMWEGQERSMKGE